MKKKWIALIIVVALVFIMSTLLTACGLTDTISEAIKEAQKEEGTDNEDNGGEGSETGTPQYDAQKTSAQIKESVGDKYLVTYDVFTDSNDKNSVTIAADSNYYYVNGNLFLRKGYNNYMYSDGNNDGKYDSITRYPLDVDPYEVLSYMLMYTDTINYTAKSNTTFLGRAAVKYVNKSSAATIGYAASYTEEFIIDSQTGVCLKRTATYEGTGVGVSGSASATFECKVFKTDADVSLFFAEQRKNIDIAEWEGEFLAAAGFNVADEFEGELISSQKHDYSGNDEWTARYNLNAGKVNGALAINVLMQRFYNGNATVDIESETVVDAWNNEKLYTDLLEEYDYIKFNAATSVSGKSGVVEVSGTYESDDEYWYVTVNVKK